MSRLKLYAVIFVFGLALILAAVGQFLLGNTAVCFSQARQRTKIITLMSTRRTHSLIRTPTAKTDSLALMLALIARLPSSSSVTFLHTHTCTYHAETHASRTQIYTYIHTHTHRICTNLTYTTKMMSQVLYMSLFALPRIGLRRWHLELLNIILWFVLAVVGR